ncbi:MAG: hypothetical protein QF662_02345 [Phycisphaerae bacterium]|nr:hypothetical protein [Phycisphaerae bacterium]
MAREISLSENDKLCIQERLASVEYTCPWCNHTAAPRKVDAVNHYDFVNFICIYQLHAPVTCDRCEKSAILVVGANQGSGNIILYDVMPPSRPPLMEGVPPGIAADMAEADLCLGAGAHKAAVAMALRTLRRAALHREASEGDTLLLHLRRLAENGVLAQNTFDEMVSVIGEVGDTGIEPGEFGDLLETLTLKQTERILGATRRILEALYS